MGHDITLSLSAVISPQHYAFIPLLQQNCVFWYKEYDEKNTFPELRDNTDPEESHPEGYERYCVVDGLPPFYRALIFEWIGTDLCGRGWDTWSFEAGVLSVILRFKDSSRFTDLLESYRQFVVHIIRPLSDHIVSCTVEDDLLDYRSRNYLSLWRL